MKIALLPVIVAVTVIRWLFIFLIGFSSVFVNILAGVLLLTVVLSYLMAISDDKEALGMIATGFAVFMVLGIGGWIVMQITILNMIMRDFIGS